MRCAVPRLLATQGAKALMAKMEKVVASETTKIKALRAAHGQKILSKSSVDACYAGTRGVTTMVYEPSLLDSEEGIRFRGLSIPECQKVLTKHKGGTEMQPEAMLWLLLTGEAPTAAETAGLTEELHARLTQHKEVIAMIDTAISAFPKTLHPMVQFTSASALLSGVSTFAKQYAAGMRKADYWKAALDDTLTSVALVPRIAAKVFQHTYADGRVPAAPAAGATDWTGVFCHQIGKTDAHFAEAMRLYFAIHVDHEGGNVSAHATQLVGSALSDPMLSFSAGMAGLAGPLHGLANQEVLLWLQELSQTLKTEYKLDIATASVPELKTAVEAFTRATLKSGKVVPGFGHAVLRKTDPRYMAQREFAQREMPNFPLFKLCDAVFQAVPSVLGTVGKIKNPWPNVDAHSGVLLQYFKLTQADYYTVLFGISRCLGVLSALVWNRACGVPIERPKSVTTEWIAAKFKNDAPDPKSDAPAAE